MEILRKVFINLHQNLNSDYFSYKVFIKVILLLAYITFLFTKIIVSFYHTFLKNLNSIFKTLEINLKNKEMNLLIYCLELNFPFIIIKK